jgi:hypothetical protein
MTLPIFNLLEPELAEYHALSNTADGIAIDPVRLAHRLGIQPDDWQTDFLRSHARQMILLCSRQSGKSRTASLLATHTAVYEPDSLVLLLSPSLRQSQELFRKCLDAYSSLDGLGMVSAEAETRLRLELENNSRIVALPGKESTIRGFSGPRLLIVDEAARVPDELYQAIRPMLAVSGGRIVLLSTPFGKRGFFYSEWTEGDSDWLRVKVTAYDCPRIDRAWLESERRRIGDWWFQQEYLCEFVDSIDQVFATELIQAALDSSLQPLFGA